MKWFGTAVKVEQFDDGDRLRFRTTSQRRLIALIVPMIGGFGFLYAWHVGASWLVLLGAIALIGFPVFNWFEVRVTELRVTELDMVAEDSGETLWVLWKAVMSLQFAYVEDRPHGLYAVQTDGSMVCLMPDVNDEQTGEMIHAIYSRFPYVAMAEASESPFLFSEQAALTVLKLSKDNAKLQ